MFNTDKNWKIPQEKAIEMRDKFVLVSAAAGSGKTTVLTERVISRILDNRDPVDISDLLIVTFTRAAAEDLKSKIANALSEALEKKPGDTQLTKQLLQLGGAQITTIDAFYLYLVRTNFERLGLPATFRIANENELKELSCEILNDLISDFYRRYEENDDAEDVENPFLNVRKNQFTDCIDNVFDGTSKGDLAELLLGFYCSFSARKEGIGTLAKSAELLRAEAEADFLHTRHGSYFAGQIKQIVTSYANSLAELKTILPLDSTYLDKMEGLLFDGTEHCKAVFAAIEKNEWEPLRAALASFSFQQYTYRNVEAAEWKEKYNLATKLCKGRLDEFQTIIKTENPVDRKQNTLRTAQLAEMLYRFFGEYEQRLLSEKIARGILDFNDVRNFVYQMLTDEKNASFVKELNARYKEVYIDEYQDVDEVQDEIFSIIGGQRRFMVGDIKQSIYEFRGSSPNIFSGYRKSMPLFTSSEAEKSNSVCIFMSDNFRCDKPIIEFANHVCSFLFSASPDSIGYLPQDDLTFSKPDSDPQKSAPVKVCIFDKQEGESKQEPANEARWIATEIARLIREEKKDNGTPILPEDIAILVRKNDLVSLYQKELEALHIPIISSSGGQISDSPLLIDLLNLLRVIDNPYRDIPLSEYLQSAFGGFSMEELRQLRGENASRQSLFDALIEASNSSHPLAIKAGSFVTWVEKYRHIATVQSADRFLRILYRDPKFAGVSHSPEFLAVYEQARTYQQISWSGLYGFLNYLTPIWENKKISAGSFHRSGGAVHLITMHASKGLEFPVVFVAGCGGKKKNKDSSKMILHPSLGFASGLYDAETGETIESIQMQMTKIICSDDSIEEEIRLLYVALTRARERLYITGSPTRKAESFEKDVSQIRQGDRYSILHGKSYLDWIVAALKNNPAKLSLQILHPTITESSGDTIPLQQTNSESTLSPNESLAMHFQTVMQKFAAFSYPLDALRGIPTKVAASKLNANMLDLLKGEDEVNAVRERIRLMQSDHPTFQSLLEAQKKPTSAEVGTATHAFLASCQFENLVASGVDAELERLLQNGFLTSEAAKNVNRKALERFAKSAFLQNILHAKQIFREQQFSLFLPLDELTENRELAAALKGQELFVQGSIDLVLIKDDGKIELYDYKTDHITEEEKSNPALLQATMLQRHGNQLKCYARAVKQLYGKLPDSVFIFSLSIGQSINIPLQ